MSDKSEQVKDAIETVFPGTKAAIAAKECTMCRHSISMDDFVDALSIREYEISGMCQKCQNLTFSEPEDDHDS